MTRTSTTQDRNPAVEDRAMSGTSTKMLLGHVQSRGGEAAVQEVLDRAGLPHERGQLERGSHWLGLAEAERLLAAVPEVLGDPRTLREVGPTSVAANVSPGLTLLLRGFGSPEGLFRQLPRNSERFSSTRRLDLVDLAPGRVTFTASPTDGHAPSGLACDLTVGLLLAVPAVFGLPLGECAHTCPPEGASSCTYTITWQARQRRRWWRRATAPVVDPELVALRHQLHELQVAAGDLIAAEDPAAALATIAARASSAVAAPGHLLAVRPPGGGAPWVFGAGMPDADADRLARQLLTGAEPDVGLVVVEVASQRRRHGVLAVLRSGDETSTALETTALAPYAGHAAAALDLFGALHDARQETARTGALLQLARALATADGVPGISAAVTAVLPTAVGCDGVLVLVQDPTSGLLQITAEKAAGPRARGADRSYQPTPDADRRLRELLAAGGGVLRRPGEGRPPLPGLPGQVCALAPLVAVGTTVGVVVAVWAVDAVPDEADAEVLGRLLGVGDQVALALGRSRLLDEMRHQANHDALTGLPNRRLFLEEVEHAVVGPGAAVLFCDLDGFKGINDTLGHAAGDELLRQVAARLLAVVRPGDLVARLGGDEFAVLLRGAASPAGAESLARRIRRCYDEPFRLDGTAVSVGTSVGVSTHPDDGTTADALLLHADAGMYRDKQRRKAAR